MKGLSHTIGLVWVLLFAGDVLAQEPQPIRTDLEELMSRVLKKREIDGDRLHHYVFSEREVLEVRGEQIPPLANFQREYTWFVRDGYLVRSPTRMNGVKVSREEQARSEAEYFRRSKKRREKKLDRESFFGFKFEPGRYLYAGKRKFEGRDVLAVEYYPRFTDDKDEKRSKREEHYEKMFEKTFLVTMLVVPEENQIVQITFDNVGLDFLPLAWLIRFGELNATMAMDKPFEEVWLPKRLYASGAVRTAVGSYSVRYSREFFDYTKTEVRVKLRYDLPEPENKKP